MQYSSFLAESHFRELNGEPGDCGGDRVGLEWTDELNSWPRKCHSIK